MVREETGQVNISSRLRLERGDQGEALSFSLMCTGKQRKDLEQGNDRRLVSRRIPLARETDAGGERVEKYVREYEPFHATDFFISSSQVSFISWSEN